MLQRKPGTPVGFDQAVAESRQRDPGRRASGVANMGVYGGPEAVAGVKAFVEDEVEAVRVAAWFALALLGQAEALPKLIEVLAHEKHEFRKRAAVALQSTTGAGITADHESAENCAAAKKAYEGWWKAASGKLAWDAKKKAFGEGAAKKK